MARVTPGGTLPGRPKSLRGRVVFRTYRGQLIAQRWPRPRGRPKTERHKRQVEWFRQAQKLAKRVDAKTQATIMAQTAGSPLMPRDLATSLMAGRMFSVTLGPNRWIRSRRAMADVSQSLDTIDTTPGHILVRGQQHWQGMPLPVGAAQWFNPAPEIFWSSQTSSNAQAWRGNVIQPLTTILLTHVGLIANLTAGGVYRGAVCTLDGTFEITDVQLSNPQPAAATGLQFAMFPVDAVLEPGAVYGILAGRTDALATTPLPTTFATPAGFSVPLALQRWARLATTLPTVGQQLDTGTPGLNSIIFRATF